MDKIIISHRKITRRSNKNGKTTGFRISIPPTYDRTLNPDILYTVVLIPEEDLSKDEVD